MTLRIARYDGGAVTFHDAVDIPSLCGDDGTLLWVDVVEPTPDELRCVQEQFGLHELAMEDVTKHQQRPKLEQYPNHSFLVAKSAALQEVDLFWGRGWLLSVREHDERAQAWPIDNALARFERMQPESGTSGFLLYVILDDLVDGYFDAADRAEDELEELEDHIFGDVQPDEKAIQERLFDIRRDLLLFRRAVSPMRDVLATLLRDGTHGIDDLTRIHLQDVFDHVLRAMDMLDTQRELMGNAVEAHLAIISNRMNEVMKKMTSWGAILLGATLVAGIYGMNFQHMPEIDWAFGYPFALALMATVTITGFWYFRRKDWL